MAERRLLLASDAAGYGGAEVVLVTLARHWHGHAGVSAIVPAGNHALRQQLLAAGADVLPVGGLARHSRPGTVSRIRRLVTARRPSAVVVNLTDQGDGTGLVQALSAAAGRCIGLLHLWIPRRSPARDARSVRSLRRLGALAVPSDGVAHLLRAQGLAGAVVPVAPQPVPPLSRQVARARLGLPADRFVVGGIGRMHEQKGWDVLIRAMPTLRRRSPDAVGLVLGDGRLRRSLQRAGQPQGVRFPGARAEAAAYLGGFDVTVLPSRYEGLPLVAMESLLVGVPVVGADVVGVRDVLSDTGTLVPADDPVALGNALADIADDPAAAAARGRVAQAAAQQRFTVDRMVEAMTRLLDERDPVVRP